MPLYALVIRHTNARWDDRPQAERDRIIRRYYEWSDGLEREGVKRGARSLADGGRIVKVKDDLVTDGPFTETKEIVGGFVLIETDGWDDAVRHARGCPALEIGDSVEVREVTFYQRPD